ncbi:hypothetical protein HK097_006080 [Rhizophlyctis rosea]|uniref:HD domain-containing protein n=1 Tax=Rhizophlyctis rosea TaxID=64517 RepID=A0AAD5X6K9_9FUNG|nr:hypothetical protein HK097_006080 [Rhizophlyctis rosea]
MPVDVTIPQELQRQFYNLVHYLEQPGVQNTPLTPPSASAVKWWTEIETRYSEPQRHYHTLEHIGSMHYLLEESDPKDFDVISLAIFFHDIIYDPKANDNELQSMELFRQFAEELNMPEAMKTPVLAFIEATIKHNLVPSITDSGILNDLKLFLDFDLEVLGREPADYNRYAQQIRAEYSHVPPEDYCKGRPAVLKRFLAREQLYFSPKFQQFFEESARRNLQAEIKRLENGNLGSSV